MFILSFRDNEIAIGHPLRQVMSQIPAEFIQRIALQPLSRAAVDKLSKAKAYDGARVFSITGSNPFYVTEIIGAQNQEIPRTLSDTSILFKLDINSRIKAVQRAKALAIL